MYDFVSIVCELFVLILFLGCTVLFAALVWCSSGSWIRDRVKEASAELIAQARNVFHPCFAALKRSGFRSSADAKNKYSTMHWGKFLSELVFIRQAPSRASFYHIMRSACTWFSELVQLGELQQIS